MLCVPSLTARRLAVLAVAALLAAGPSAPRVLAQTTPTFPVVGCNGASIPGDTDAETNDDNESDSTDRDSADNAPPIVGTIRAPSGMKENDKRLAALAKITPDQARDAALAVIPDVQERRVRSIGVETEQEYVIYAVKTVRTTPGVDPKLEVKVDAGNATVLLMECDPNDD